MSFNHVVIWLDHQEAHVIHFNHEAAEAEHLRAHSTHRKQHHKAGSVGSGHAEMDVALMNDIADAVAGSTEILVTGPGSAKLHLMRHFIEKRSAIGKKVVGVETTDHPNDAQLLAYARAYFVKVDRMLGDSVLA